MTKEALLNSPTAAACITPTRPTYKNRSHILIDESPTLSQEPMNVDWKWNSNDSPVRPLGDSIKSMRSIRHVLGREKGATSSTVTSNAANERRDSFTDDAANSTLTEAAANDTSNSSPKGLYKFQEELRRINEQNAATTQNANDDVDGHNDSYADERDTSTAAFITHQDSCSLSPIAAADENANDAPLEPLPTTSNEIDTLVKQTENKPNLSDSTLNAFKNDLLNDSDFDQVLFTCGEKIDMETRIAQTQTATTAVDRKVLSTNDTKTSGNKATITSTAVNSSLFDNDESIDDIIGNIDDTFIMNSMMKMKQSTKFTRHNSMPPKADNNNTTATTSQRRSFIRHESMPVTTIENRQAPIHAKPTATLSQMSTESAQSSLSRKYYYI